MVSLQNNLPAGETAVRYENKQGYGLMIVSSFSFLEKVSTVNSLLFPICSTARPFFILNCGKGFNSSTVQFFGNSLTDIPLRY